MKNQNVRFSLYVLQVQYWLSSIIVVPLLPLLFLQGKRIISSVPRLPAATGDSGVAGPDRTSGAFHLLAIGESTVAGIGVSTHEEGFTGAIANELASKLNKQVHWKVYAHSGYTAERVRTELVPKINESTADLIVVGLGANNAFKLHSPLRWFKEIDNLVKDLNSKFPKAIIAFAPVPPIKIFPAFTLLIKFVIGNLAVTFSEILENRKTSLSILYRHEIVTMDWLKAKAGNPNLEPKDFFSDGVHPSKLTYQMIARDFARFIVDSNCFRE